MFDTSTSSIVFTALHTLETWAGSKAKVVDDFYIVKKSGLYHYFVYDQGQYRFVMSTEKIRNNEE